MSQVRGAGRRVVKSWVAVGVVGLIAGCAGAPKVPIFVDPTFAALDIRMVTLLPIVDRRVDKSYEMDIESSIGNKVEAQLNKKGYTVARPGAFSDEEDVPNGAVAEMEPNEMTRLGGAGSDYLLVAYVDDLSGKTALGYSFKTETSAVLVKRDSGALVWRDKGVGSAGQGGLIGCMMAGAVKGEALDMAVDGMMSSLPPVPKAVGAD